MRIKHLLVCFLVTPLPVLLTSRPADAINLVYTNLFPSSPNYQPIANYKTNVGNDGILTRDFLTKIAPPNTRSKFWRALNSSYPVGWDFRRSGTPVYGDFLIDEYKVCPPFSDCASLSTTGSVGAKLNLAYRPNFTFSPNTRQPDPDSGRVRWIQWVRSNHPVNGRHGDKESIIDIDITSTGRFPYDPGTPFYYSKVESFNRQTPYRFDDAPARTDIGWNHDWIAELYLAEEITKPGSNTRKVLI
ncbi:MAG: hypothetical protein KME64_23240 [Scytonematopsis contorta HA4267-MV1]|jgi:hypothetical protein|nr:hypothetical protein [Scytonematopsis contorta HA4267-MV1]